MRGKRDRNETNKSEHVDVLVIGAGPSGTVAASILQKEGIQVKVVEKGSFPRFVIGESLLPRCMDNLEQAGLLEAVNKAGFQKKYGARFLRNGEICDFNFSNQFTKGWSWTWQVQRARFDQVLADTACKNGVNIEYKTEVVDVNFDKNGSSVARLKTSDGNEKRIHAKYILDASGYGRVLPRLLDLNCDSNFPARMSFFCHVKDGNRSEDIEPNRITIEMYSDKIWVWIIPLSNGTTSVGIVGRPEDVECFTGNEKEQFFKWINRVPLLNKLYSQKELAFEPKKAKSYSVAVKQLFGKGYVLTGNSTEFLDPVFSSGVTFATESGALAAKLIARELKGESINWETQYSDYMNRGVDVFRTFVAAWYDGSLQKIFFRHNANPEIKKQICSVLSGYVWDMKNPFVKKHQRAVKALAQVV